MTIRSYQILVQALVTPSAASEPVTRSVTSVLTLETVVRPGLVKELIESELLLSDEATYTVDEVPPTEASNALVLFSQADWFTLPSGVSVVESELGLQQEVSIFGYEQVESDLALTQDVSSTGPVDRIVNHSSFFGFASFVIADPLRVVESELNLSSTASKTQDYSVISNLSLVSDAFRAYTGESDLSLVSTVDWGFGYEVSDTLVLTSVATRDLILNQTVSNGSIVEQACSYFIESRCNRLTRNSFQGTGGVAPSTKPLTYTNKLLLQSKDDPTSIVVLRNPETDDRKRYTFERVNRNYYDNTLDLYSDPAWFDEETQLYTVVALKRSILDDLFSFLQINLGKPVILKDWKGISWDVVISNPGELYSEDRDGYWVLDFEVVGSPTNGEYTASKLVLDGTISRAGSIYIRTLESEMGLTDLTNRDYDLGPSSSLSFTNEATAVVV